MNPKGWGPVDPPENLEEVTLNLDAVRDGYGKPDDPYYAVRAALPQTVRHAAAATEDCRSTIRAGQAGARCAEGQSHLKSLIGFLRSRSIKGLKDPDGELKRMDAGRVARLDQLDKSGTDLHYALRGSNSRGLSDPKGWGPVDPPENLEEVTLAILCMLNATWMKPSCGKKPKQL